MPKQMSEKKMEKSSRRVKTSKNPTTEIERVGSDEGLKRKQVEIDMQDSNESQKLTSAVKQKTTEAEEVKNIHLCLKLTFLIYISTNVHFLLIMKKKVFNVMCVKDDIPHLMRIH